MKKVLFCALFVLIGATVLLATVQTEPLSEAVIKELIPIRNSVSVIQDATANKFISPDQAAPAINHYLALARKIAGRPITLQELMAVNDAPLKLTAAQKFVGFITFVNIIWVIAIALGVGCFIYLFGDLVKHLVEILVGIPAWFYELVFYGFSTSLVFYADYLRPGVGHYVALTGCLLFAGALGFTFHRHRIESGTSYFLILTLAFGTVALVYTSPMIGFVTIGALMATLGFFAEVIPFGYVVGFRDDDALGRGTSAALIVLALFVTVKIMLTNSRLTEVFQPGALWLGSFVGFLGLLIASSRWYDRRRFHYVAMQIVTVIAGMAALFIGSVFQIPELQRIGGTFFVLYLTEKPAEIPMESARGYAILGLIISAAIYFFCMKVKADPEVFRPYLLF